MTEARYPNRLDPRQQPAARAAQQPPAPPSAESAFDFEERLEPRHIKLEEGEIFTGTLCAIERITISGKWACRYRAEEFETREMVTFNGTYQIDSKLSPRDVGHIIEVRCEGTDKNVERNGNFMKKFRVRVSKQTAPGWASDGTPITDDDLPPFSDADVPASARK
jgi:hypothetical protein